MYIEQYGTRYLFIITYRTEYLAVDGEVCRGGVGGGGGGGFGEKTGTGNRDRAFSALYNLVPTTTLPHRSMISEENFFANVFVAIIIVIVLALLRVRYTYSNSEKLVKSR